MPFVVFTKEQDHLLFVKILILGAENTCSQQKKMPPAPAVLNLF
jgi:hypothetical protein